MVTTTFGISKRFVILLVLSTLLCLSNTVVRGQEVSETLKLKAEILKLKIEVAKKDADIYALQTQLQIYRQAVLTNPQTQTDSLNLTREQSKLEEEFRSALKPKDSEKFNWDTLKFEKKDEKDNSIKPAASAP